LSFGEGSLTAWDGLGLYQGLANPIVSAHPDAEYKAASQLLSNYLKASNSWRGGNFLAEFRETVEMFAHPLSSFYRQTWHFADKVRGIKRYALDKPKYKKALADLWLGYKFGVLPTISDLNDATEAITRLQYGLRHDTIKLRGKGSISEMEISSGIVLSGASANLWRSSWDQKADYHVFYQGAVIAGPENGATILREFGVGVFDVLPAVWEAIPFSWLIDYFTNVSEVLDSMRFWNVTPAWLNRTVRNSRTLNLGAATQRDQTKATYTATVSDGGYYGLKTFVTRSAVGSMPYPGFKMKFPAFSSQKWLNVAALATQILSSKP
jgi:hypothetical protein